jgi:signal transduction histidine kinase
MAATGRFDYSPRVPAAVGSMKRQRTAGGKAAKGRTRKTAPRKRRVAPKRRPAGKVAAAGLRELLDRKTRELDEAHEQQKATAEVLRIISSSPGALEPVFKAMLANATRICDANFGIMTLYEGGPFRAVALHNAPPEFAEARRQESLFQPAASNPLARVAVTKQILQIPDIRNDECYLTREPAAIIIAERGGARTLIDVPMLKDGELVGVMGIYRQEVRPFTDKQIDLLTNFAAQAVIAIENTRLLNELRQRTDDLTESLEQQTATSEVLKVISSSPGELEPVFQSMLENATRICEASFGNLLLYEGSDYRVAAMHGSVPAWTELRRREPLIPFGSKNPLARILATKTAQHIADIRTDEAYVDGDQSFTLLADLTGARTLLMVPMLKDNELVGIIGIYRQEVRPFSDKQVALVTNFAAQAVIAIENTRLLNELRQSLDQQTATADVLRVISSSPGDLAPVFEALLANAIRICDAKFGILYRPEAGGLRLVAAQDVPPAFAQLQGSAPFHPAPYGALGQVMRTKQTVHLADLAATRAYAAHDPQVVAAVGIGGVRTVVGVPLLKDNELIGVIAIFRQEVRAFNDNQVELLTNFAAQAVIAIENTRLLSELRQSLQQQTATADVLKVISRSTFNLQAVLDTLIESAARLCRADRASITLPDGKSYRRAASFGFSEEFTALMDSKPLPVDRSNIVGRVVLEGKTVQVDDVRSDTEITYVTASMSQAGPTRTILGVPMLRESVPVGVLVLTRAEVEPFTDAQIALVETFADQAVIAIENVRLFEEIQDKSRQLEVASKHKSQFLANMSHELRTPLNAILGYTELILDNIYGEAPVRMRTVLDRVQANGKHLLGLINDVLDLSKIEAGQLVLSLNDYSIKEIVHGVYAAVESLANNKKLGFKIAVPPNLPPAHGDDRRLSQVLLNLVGNAIKFTDAGEIIVEAAAGNGAYTISVRDTGPGIAETDQAKIFDEFQQADSSQTKAKGGTGLGLSIARRIVELHGGRLWVESTPGHGSTFSFTVPFRVDQQAMRS